MQQEQFEKTKVSVGLIYTISNRVMTNILSNNKIGGKALNTDQQSELEEAFNVIITNKLRKKIV